MELTLIYKGHSDITEGVSQATGQPWRKCFAVFEETGQTQFPKQIAFTAMNSTVQRVLELTPNFVYRVNFDISSREYNGKWYTDAKAWAINDAAGADAPATPIQEPKPPMPKQTDMFNQPQPFAGGDLPF